MSDLSGWEVSAAVATAVTAVGGLVLGLRAEFRNSRYEPRFEIQEDFASGWLTLRNRTGETAVNVHATLRKGNLDHAMGEVIPLLQADKSITVFVDRSDSGPGSIEPVAVVWERETTRQKYRQSDYRNDDRSFRQRVADAIRGSEPGFRRARPRGRKVAQ